MPTDFGRRLKLARNRARLTQAKLAPLVGMSQSNLSELETVAFESGKTVQLAAVLGVDPGWLATGEGTMLPASALELRERPPAWTAGLTSLEGQGPAKQNVTMAHHLSDLAALKAPNPLDWSAVVPGPLPARFTLTVLDDAMMLLDPPSMRTGDLAIFAPTDTAAPGAVVLVADAEDNLYIRRYQQRTPTRWAAVARNEAYQPLDSERDGLRVLALQVGSIWNDGAIEAATTPPGANRRRPG